MSNPEKHQIKSAEQIKKNLYANEASPTDVAELNKFVLEGKDGDKEITRKMLKENFAKYEGKINEILKEGSQVSIIKKAFENAKSQEEKAELAEIFQQKKLSAKYDVALEEIEKSLSEAQKKLAVEKDPDRKQELENLQGELKDLQDSLKKELNQLTIEVKDQISSLSRVVEAYNIAEHNNLTVKGSQTKADQQRVHKTARETRKVFRNLSSQEVEGKAKNAEVSLKLQPKEAQIMRWFAGIVSDVIRDSGKSSTEDGVLVEKFVLDFVDNYSLEDFSDQDIIQKFADKGLTIKKESWAARREGLRGVVYLRDVAKFYNASHDLKDADAYNSGANLRKYFDLIRETGSFQSALDTFNPEITKAHDLRKLPRDQRFTTLIENKKVTNDNFDKVMDLCLDFNLDGLIVYGDTGIKGGNQIKEMFNKFITPEEKKQAFENVLKAVSKANKVELENKNLTVDDVLKDFKRFSMVQKFLKNPPMDMNYVLKYGEQAFDEYKKAMTAESPLTLEERAAIDKKVSESAADIQQKTAGEVTTLEAKSATAKAEGKEQEAEAYAKAAETLKKFRDMDARLLREGLRELLEGQAAAIRQSGLGAGVDIPLTKILRGLSFNFGARYNKDGSLNAGVNLAWNGSVDISENGRFKGFAGISAGTNLLSIPILGGTVGLGYTFENAKQGKSLDLRTEKTFTLGVGGLIAPGVIGWNINAGLDRDFEADRIKQQEKIRSSVGNLVMDLMSDLEKKTTTQTSEEGKDKKTDSTAETRVFSGKPYVFDANKLKEVLETTYPKTKKETLDEAVKNLGQILQFYEGAPMDEANVSLIAEEIAKAYSQAWSNMQALKLVDKGWYISGGGLSVSFFQGVIPVVGILKIARHKFNGSSDTKQSLENFVAMREQGKGNLELADESLEKNLLALEQQLGVAKGTLSVVADQDGSAAKEGEKADYIQVSLDTLLAKSTLALDPSIKKNLKIDTTKRTIIVHKNTLFRASSGYLSDSKAMTLDVGAHRTDKSAQIITKDTVNDFFANGVNEWTLGAEAKINPEVLPKLAASLDTKKFDQALKDLKKQITEAGYDFPKEYESLSIKKTQTDDGQEVYGLYNNGAFIKDANGRLIGIPEGKHLIIDATSGEVQFKFEDIKKGKENFKIKFEALPKNLPISADVLKVDGNIQTLIEGLYGNLSLLKSNAIRNVSHKATGNAALTRGYTQWREALSKFCCELPQERNYGNINAAAKVMEQLLTDMDKYIQKTDGASKKGIFADILSGDSGLPVLMNSNKYDDKVKLQQLLLALDGMFSRTTNVRGTSTENQYQLQYGAESNKNTFNQITTDISTKIIARMKKKSDQFDCYEDYEKLFNSMNEGAKGIDSTVSAVVKKGVIAYNYGNPDDMMRPIVNPHIIEGTENENKELIPNAVKLHVLKQLFQEDSILVMNILQELKFKSGSTKDLDALRGQIYAQLGDLLDGKPIDIGGKKVTMSAKFSTAFFAQCVNHMVMIGDLQFSVEGTPGTPGQPDGNKKKFESEISRSAQAVANAEGIIQNNNTTQRFAVGAELMKIDTRKPGETIITNEVETDPNDGSRSNPGETPNPNDSNTGVNDGSGNITPPNPADPVDTPNPDTKINQIGTSPVSPRDEQQDF